MAENIKHSDAKYQIWLSMVEHTFDAIAMTADRNSGQGLKGGLTDPRVDDLQFDGMGGYDHRESRMVDILKRFSFSQLKNKYYVCNINDDGGWSNIGCFFLQQKSVRVIEN